MTEEQGMKNVLGALLPAAPHLNMMLMGIAYNLSLAKLTGLRIQKPGIRFMSGLKFRINMCQAG